MLIRYEHSSVEDWIRTYRGEPFHALYCDPPYGIHFASLDWDKDSVVFQSDLWAGIKQHLRPGAFGMVYSSSRTYHRLAVAIEDAGFTMYPHIFGWVHGQAFPRASKVDSPGWESYRYGRHTVKPSLTPIVVFQAPYSGRAIDCISKNGTGAMNTDIGDRWPSNLYVDENAAHLLDHDTGRHVSGYFHVVKEKLDSSSSVHYVPRASRSEKDAGLDLFPTIETGVFLAKGGLSLAGNTPVGKNPHKTIKPIELTRIHTGLLLPPDTIKNRSVVVPFAGVASEVIGAALSGWDSVIGIEADGDYVEIAKHRISQWTGIRLLPEESCSATGRFVGQVDRDERWVQGRTKD